MKLVVGLGNPGAGYVRNRHNLGFRVLDYFAEANHIDIGKAKHEHSSLINKSTIYEKNVLLVRPLVYMNLSGQAVKGVAQYYKINLKDILVITEDINLELGVMKIRASGNAGGHNGLKSIAQHLGSEEYTRLRVGVGYDSRIALDRYVLSNFSRDEEQVLESGFPHIANCIMDFIKGFSIDKLMASYNGKYKLI